MLTDWLIVRRIAAELERTLRGARIAAVGLLPDGRFALDLGRARLVLDPFAATPLAWLASGEQLTAPLAAGGSWPRAFAASLTGKRIERIAGRTGDRLLAIDCSARSRFGVESGYRLVAELVPKFGNLLLLKDQTIVAAAKEFEPARDSAARSIVVGAAYEPPPLPAGPPVAGVTAGAGDRASRALRSERPLLPRLVADAFVADAARVPWPDDERLQAHVRARADALLGATESPSDGLGDVWTYRRGAALEQFHIVPLPQFARELTEARVCEVLPLCAEVAGAARDDATRDSFEKRRRTLERRVTQRLAALARARAALERDGSDAGAADVLRDSGELLYAHAHEIGAGASSFVPPERPELRIVLDPELDAKGNAAAIFKRYRKAAGRREHAQRRGALLETDEAQARELAWEVARAAPDTLDELTRAVDRLDGRGTAIPGTHAPPKRSDRDAAKVRRGTRAARAPQTFVLGADARLLIGRSPEGNAELTFRIARPDDTWFHARGVPGAHAVLQIDAAREPTAAELTLSAEAAAYFSPRRDDDKVAVDYTLRKHVRKQDAGPGLVWYVNAATLTVTPREPAVDAPV